MLFVPNLTLKRLWTTLLYLNVFTYGEGGGGEQRKKEGKEREGRKVS